MAEPRTYYTEGNKSEKQTLHINTYIWNLKDGTYFQGSSGDTDIENRLVDTGGGGRGEGEMYGESNMESYITICKIDSQWGFSV